MKKVDPSENPLLGANRVGVFQRLSIDLKYAKSVIAETHAFAARMAYVNPEGPGLATIRDTLAFALALFQKDVG